MSHEENTRYQENMKEMCNEFEFDWTEQMGQKIEIIKILYRQMFFDHIVQINREEFECEFSLKRTLNSLTDVFENAWIEEMEKILEEIKEFD